MKNTILGLALCVVWPVFAQQKAMVTVHPQQGTQVINKAVIYYPTQTGSI